ASPTSSAPTGGSRLPGTTSATPVRSQRRESRSRKGASRRRWQALGSSSASWREGERPAGGGKWRSVDQLGGVGVDPDGKLRRLLVSTAFTGLKASKWLRTF